MQQLRAHTFRRLRKNTNIMKLFILADGACWGNPGHAAIGAVVKDQHGTILTTISEYIGSGTNNQAEYKALIAGLKAALALKATEVHITIDSELVERQLNGRYAVKNALLRPLFLETLKHLKRFHSYTITHATHDENHEAHTLAQTALKAFIKEQG